ncbi:MAG: methanogenesis marker 9 domain-containing protein [Euryarchaeota archaeon]|nr:methanogenesis marker 9 domain-containing protein [Euryarchaeota archaeon]
MTNIDFGISIGDIKIPNPLVLASVAGLTDSSFAASRSVGLAILGGYNVDTATIEAARSLIKKGRSEFAYEKPKSVIENELAVMKTTDMAAAVNLRSATLEPLLEIAECVRKRNAILELNAHCRQPEMQAVGVGQRMLFDLDKLEQWIREIKQTDVTLSVKVRAGVTEDVVLARAIERAGADAVHIDTMNMGPKLIKKVRDQTSLKIIANNSIVDYESAHKMLSMGADLVSVARAAIAGNAALEEILSGLEHSEKTIGWYNAPKHICAGGDLRGLTFCCMPVKDCPLSYVLKRAGIKTEQYVRTKESFINSKLGRGANTCFGSMVWCCKITRPCPWRDSTLQDDNISDIEYMQLKKELAQKLLSCRELE